MVSHFSLNILLKLRDISTFKPVETSYLLIRSSEKMSGQKKNWINQENQLESIIKDQSSVQLLNPHPFFIDERLPHFRRFHTQYSLLSLTSPLREFKTLPFIDSILPIPHFSIQYSPPFHKFETPLHELKIPLYPCMDSILSLHNF